MGIIRGGLLVIVCVLFFIGLLITNSLITIYTSLDHKDVQNNLRVVMLNYAEKQVNSTELINDKELIGIQKYCQNSSSYTFKENLTGLNINVDISCTSINNGKAAIMDEFINETIEQIYYKDYPCDLSSCLKDKNNAFYLVSEEFHDYLSGKVYILLLVSLVLFALMLILAQHRSNAFIIVGILMVVSSLPFMKLDSIISSLSGDSLYGVAKVFLANSYAVFIGSLILGILFLVIGFIIKFFTLGFKISDFFNKFKKKEEITDEKVSEIVKEEISKSKEEIDKVKKEEIKKQEMKPKNNKDKG